MFIINKKPYIHNTKYFNMLSYFYFGGGGGGMGVVREYSSNNVLLLTKLYIKTYYNGA